MRITVALLLAFLTACGGGDSRVGPQKSRPPVVGFWGDSITSGSVNTSAGWLSPRPVERMQQLAGDAFVALDRSLPGATALDALAGLQPFDLEGIDVVVLRYGMADAVRQVHADDRAFAQAVDDLVLRAGARRVVLTGIPKITVRPDLPGVDDALVAQVAAYDLALRELAARRGIPFIDVRALPFAITDLADTIHPAQGYSDRIAALIVRQLLEAFA